MNIVLYYIKTKKCPKVKRSFEQNVYLKANKR